MRDDLAQDLVDLRGFGLRAKGAAELRLDHGEGGFDVRPLVVVHQELLAVELEEVPELAPEVGPGVAPAVVLERNEGHSTVLDDGREVRCREIRFVRADLFDVEMRASAVHEPLELGAVGGVLVGDGRARDDMGPGPAHEMRLEVLGFLALAAPLVIEPPGVGRSREAGGIHGERVLQPGEGHGRFRDQVAEDRGERRVVHVAEDGVVVRGRVDQPGVLRVPQVGGRPPSRERAVDLHHGAEYDIRTGEARATRGLRHRDREAVAQCPEQVFDPLLLVLLRGVVRGPVLPVRDADPRGLRLGGERALRPQDFNGDDVLAPAAPRLVVGTRASRALGVDVHFVRALVGLRGDNPQVALPRDLRRRRDHDSFFVPGVHVPLSSLSLM